MVLLPPVCAVEFTEVMYNPLGADASREFVEVYGVDNLSNYTFGDLQVNASLEQLQYAPGNFSLLVASSFNYTGLNVSVYTPGKKLGNGLGNSGDEIFLYLNDSLVTSVSYDGTVANGDGYSVEFLYPSFVLGGTPGYFFSAVVSSDEEDEQCVADLAVDLSSLVVNASESLGFTFDVFGPSEFVVEYAVRGEGGVVKAHRNTTSLALKSFTPKEPGLYYVDAQLYSACGDAFVSAPFFVAGKSEKIVPETSVVINTTVVPSRFWVHLLAENFNFTLNTTQHVLVNVSAGSYPVSGSLWGYVYKSSVSLSGDRQKNLARFSLAPGSSTIISLPVTVTRFREDARLKLKWQKDGFSSISDFSVPVSLLHPEIVAPEKLNATTLISSSELPAATGHVVYEAAEVRLQRLGYILGGVVGLLLLGLGYLHLLWKLWSLRRVQS